MLSPEESARLAAAARLIRTIRTGFRRLAQAADRLHADAGGTGGMAVTAAMRVVLEMLDDAGPMTVPQMARARGLSRQHFQTKVDALAERGLVEAQANPAHARSVLIAMTAEGMAVFAAMKLREGDVLLKATAGLETSDLKAALRTIETFTEAVARTTGGAGEENDDDST